MTFAPLAASQAIVSAPAGARGPGLVIGQSRQQRPLVAYRFGSGPLRISIIAGCHADEPVGPRLLAHLADYLATLPPTASALQHAEWWLIPHLNPDGAARNQWLPAPAQAADLTAFLGAAVRELPGDDLEFGFPRDRKDCQARPEAQAAAAWWRSAAGPFDLHLSLHGMGVGFGAWFLIEPAWRDRCATIIEVCSAAVADQNLPLHDVDRRGEKGFERIAPGFATRPNAAAMAAHFIALGELSTAEKFRPSSMAFMRGLGGDPLTLVPELPLFLLPAPSGDPAAAWRCWQGQLADWRSELASGRPAAEIAARATAAGIVPLPVSQQMILQLALLSAALQQLTDDRN